MSRYDFVFFLVIFSGILREKCSQGRTIIQNYTTIDCKNKTITTIPKFNTMIFPKSLLLYQCLIDSPIGNDLKKVNVSIADLKRLDLTYMKTYTALDDKYLEGLAIETLTVKSRTMLPAMRHSLYPLKNLTELELTNVVAPDLPDRLINLTLREINAVPVQLSNCACLKNLIIVNWNVDYIYEGFLVNCSNLKTVFIEFGKNRFNLHNLFYGSNISLDYLEIHDNPKLSNMSHVVPTQLSALNFSGITELKKLNLSYNHIWSISNDTFKQFHDLEVLDLSHNDLFYFDVHNLRNLGTLNLSSNPLSNEATCRIFNRSRTSYPRLENLLIDACQNATACSDQSWSAVSSTQKDENFNDTTNNVCNSTQNFILQRNSNSQKKKWHYIPCIATSAAILAIIGIFCTVTYLHRRKRRQVEKEKLENEENMKQLKLSMLRLNVDVEKMCNEDTGGTETTKL